MDAGWSLSGYYCQKNPTIGGHITLDNAFGVPVTSLAQATNIFTSSLNTIYSGLAFYCTVGANGVLQYKVSNVACTDTNPANYFTFGQIPNQGGTIGEPWTYGASPSPTWYTIILYNTPTPSPCFIGNFYNASYGIFLIINSVGQFTFSYVWSLKTNYTFTSMSKFNLIYTSQSPQLNIQVTSSSYYSGPLTISINGSSPIALTRFSFSISILGAPSITTTSPNFINATAVSMNFTNSGIIFTNPNFTGPSYTVPAPTGFPTNLNMMIAATSPIRDYTTMSSTDLITYITSLGRAPQDKVTLTDVVSKSSILSQVMSTGSYSLTVDQNFKDCFYGTPVVTSCTPVQALTGASGVAGTITTTPVVNIQAKPGGKACVTTPVVTACQIPSLLVAPFLPGTTWELFIPALKILVLIYLTTDSTNGDKFTLFINQGTSSYYSDILESKQYPTDSTKVLTGVNTTFSSATGSSTVAPCIQIGLYPDGAGGALVKGFYLLDGSGKFDPSKSIMRAGTSYSKVSLDGQPVTLALNLNPSQTWSLLTGTTPWSTAQLQTFTNDAVSILTTTADQTLLRSAPQSIISTILTNQMSSLSPPWPNAGFRTFFENKASVLCTGTTLANLQNNKNVPDSQLYTICTGGTSSCPVDGSISIPVSSATCVPTPPGTCGTGTQTATVIAGTNGGITPTAPSPQACNCSCMYTSVGFTQDTVTGITDIVTLNSVTLAAAQLSCDSYQNCIGFSWTPTGTTGTAVLKKNLGVSPKTGGTTYVNTTRVKASDLTLYQNTANTNYQAALAAQHVAQFILCDYALYTRPGVTVSTQNFNFQQACDYGVLNKYSAFEWPKGASQTSVQTVVFYTDIINSTPYARDLQRVTYVNYPSTVVSPAQFAQANQLSNTNRTTDLAPIFAILPASAGTLHMTTPDNNEIRIQDTQNLSDLSQYYISGDTSQSGFFYSLVSGSSHVGSTGYATFSATSQTLTVGNLVFTSDVVLQQIKAAADALAAQLAAAAQAAQAAADAAAAQAAADAAAAQAAADAAKTPCGPVTIPDFNFASAQYRNPDNSNDITATTGDVILDPSNNKLYKFVPNGVYSYFYSFGTNYPSQLPQVWVECPAPAPATATTTIAGVAPAPAPATFTLPSGFDQPNQGCIIL
jgi:hypothetical protein